MTLAIKDGVYVDEAGGERRFTAFVSYDGEVVEEIDVDARSDDHARAIAQAALDRDYEPGGKIGVVQERFGWYL